MPRRTRHWDDDVDDSPDEDVPFWGGPAVVQGFALPSPAELGLSADEALRHRVRALEIGALAGAVEALPSPEQASAWAARHGVSQALEMPASVLDPWVGWRFPAAVLGPMTVGQCLHGQMASLRRSERQAVADLLARAARDFVVYRGQRERVLAVREALWARAPEAGLEPLSRALRALHAELGENAASDKPLLIGGAAVAVGDDPPRVSAIFPEAGYATAQVAFAEGGQAARLSCSCAGRPCQHRRVLVEALLDALHGGTALAVEVAEVVSVPGWQRLLAALERTPLPAAKGGERLMWRLGRSHGGVLVQPVVQQQKAGGQWSTGRKLSADAAARRSDWAAEDREALNVFAALELLSHYCGHGATCARLLDALIGHPRLCTLDPPYQPVRLERARATVVAALEGEQLEIGVAVAGRRIEVEQLNRQMLDERWGLVFDGAQATLFELAPATSRLLGALARHGARLPPEAHARAAEILTALSRHVPVELPDGLRGQRVEARAAFVLRLVPSGALALDAELSVRIGVVGVAGVGDGTLLGAEQPPGGGERELLGCVQGRSMFAERDLESEAERAHALLKVLGLPVSTERWRWRLDGDAALELVSRSREQVSAGAGELVVEWPASEPWQARSLSKRDLRVRLERAGQWFAIGGGIAVDGVEAGLVELLAAVRSGRRFVQLGPGRFARVEAELEAAVRRIDDLSSPVNGELAVAPAAVLGLDALELPQLDGAEEWRALSARVAAAAALEPAPPSALRGNLRPYQLDGYRWLARLSAWDAGACLADDMGLGKTVQCLAVLLDRPGPHLVVAPTSVGPNWLREAEAFAPSLRVRLYRGSERAALLSDLRPGDLLITSYDLMALDVASLSEHPFDTLVLDEAQAVKNFRTRRARAARALRARLKLALTGTPVENHLGELWSILSIVSPGLLGSWEHFRERFAAPIERDGDRARMESLSAVLRPFVLRRTKAKVAPELPPRTNVIEAVELSQRERALYEAARQSALSDLGDVGRDERGRIQVLAALTRLRRLACHPGLVMDGYSGPASKLETLLGLIEQLRAEGQRALVFSQFTSFLALVKRALDGKGIEYLYLDGQTSVAERSALVGAWRLSRADLFLLSLKAGGSGLNLTGADAVIHLDPWWNPAVEDQATDRTHRIGQERPVTAIRLIAQGTIEEAVLALHEGKRSLADGLLAGTEAVAQLSSAQLIDLIRFGDRAAGAGSEEGADDEEAASGLAAAARDGEGGDAPVSREALLSAGVEGAPAKRTDEAMGGASPRLLAASDLLSLRQKLERRLCKDDLLDATVRAYVRAFDRMVELAEAEAGQRTLLSWYDASVQAHRAGKLSGPKNLPAILGAVVRRAAQLDGMMG